MMHVTRDSTSGTRGPTTRRYQQPATDEKRSVKFGKFLSLASNCFMKYDMNRLLKFDIIVEFMLSILSNYFDVKVPTYTQYEINLLDFAF